MEPDRISIVVPTLDEEARVGRCLDAIGVAPDVEVVISDGGSLDRTRTIAQGHPGARWVSGSPGRGPQLNRGAAASSGDVLLFVHADCCLPPGWKAAILDALVDPSVALACFRLHTEPAEPQRSSRWRRRWMRLLDLRSSLGRLPYGDQGFALRRDVFERLGGFPDIALMEDVELARAARREGAIRVLPLEMRTSARRVERNPVRARLMMLVFPFLHRVGVPPHRLARWYGNVR